MSKHLRVSRSFSTKIFFLFYKNCLAGKELEALEERRRQAVERNQDVTQLDSYIEDIKENINYVQETISETQHNVMAIEEAEDTSENADLQLLVAQIFDIDEAKYVINKLYNMTLSQNHAVAQRDAKLKESEATLAEVNYYLIYWSTDRSLLIWLLEKYMLLKLMILFYSCSRKIT